MGNQMFQYAYARALSKEYGESLTLNKAYYLLYTALTFYRNKPQHFPRFTLVNCNLNWDEVRVLGWLRGGIKALLIMVRFIRYRLLGIDLHGEYSFKQLTKNGYHITDDSFNFYPHSKSNNANKHVLGYFCSEKYFDSIKDIIRNELKIKTLPSKENKELLNEISSCNAVCVHIRHGNYFDNPTYEYLGICTNVYFKKGMAYIAAKIEDPVFYIFSNEIKIVKEKFIFDYPVRYVTLNNPDYEELRLMYSCKHFIISNSTFSWWGSYLSDNPERIVVAPSLWIKTHPGKVDTFRDDMTIIEIEQEA
jgi:hypothetical protein